MNTAIVGVLFHHAVDYGREGIEGALSHITEQNSWRPRILTAQDLRPESP